MGADPYDEDEADPTPSEAREEDVREDDEDEDEEAGPSGRDSAASDALDDVNDTESEEALSEDEEDETDEEMFDEKHTVDDVLRSVNDERADGPAPYEILAQRKREANEKNKEAFRAELRSRGVEERDVEGLVDGGDAKRRNGGKSGASGVSGVGRKGYVASELLERHNIDKNSLLAEHPEFAAFLGAAKQAGAVGHVARGDGPGRGRPKNPRRTRRRVVLDEAAQKLGEANALYARGPEAWPRATELLLEVIRLAPNDPDPYHTMAMIHDETAEMHREKAKHTRRLATSEPDALDDALEGAGPDGPARLETPADAGARLACEPKVNPFRSPAAKGEPGVGMCSCSNHIIFSIAPDATVNPQRWLRDKYVELGIKPAYADIMSRQNNHALKRGPLGAQAEEALERNRGSAHQGAHW